MSQSQNSTLTPQNSPQFIDTHCHIHDSTFDQKFAGKDADTLIDEGLESGVSDFICVGTDFASSRQAVELSTLQQHCYASLALHPHEAEHMTVQELTHAMSDIEELLTRTIDEHTGDTSTVVAIGECGLDYFYHDDPDTHQKQKHLLRAHFEVAQKYDLPMIFHIRNADANTDNPDTPHAFDEFFEIFDEYADVRGVVHSFSATEYELQESLKRGLYIGLNGIMTFTRNQKQLEAAKKVPLNRLVLETDAPFLTPAPYRGKVCEPRHVVVTAKFLADLRGESLQSLSELTSANARALFGIS